MYSVPHNTFAPRSPSKPPPEPHTLAPATFIDCHPHFLQFHQKTSNSILTRLSSSFLSITSAWSNAVDCAPQFNSTTTNYHSTREVQHCSPETLEVPRQKVSLACTITAVFWVARYFGRLESRSQTFPWLRALWRLTLPFSSRPNPISSHNHSRCVGVHPCKASSLLSIKSRA